MSLSSQELERFQFESKDFLQKAFAFLNPSQTEDRIIGNSALNFDYHFNLHSEKSICSCLRNNDRLVLHWECLSFTNAQKSCFPILKSDVKTLECFCVCPQTKLSSYYQMTNLWNLLAHTFFSFHFQCLIQTSGFVLFENWPSIPLYCKMRGCSAQTDACLQKYSCRFEARQMS